MPSNTRIAFVISAQHLIPHGGIGQFAKGFVDMAQENNWVVDLILDKQPLETSITEYILEKASIRFPKEQVSYLTHTKTHAFDESINYDRVTAFRDSLMQAMQHHSYDCIVINTPEALFSTIALGLQKYLKVLFYSHNQTIWESGPSVFNAAYGPMIRGMLSSGLCDIGTQTMRNANIMTSALMGAPKFVLPMPMTEKSLLVSSDHYEKDSVLFIGRWEEGKNPNAFIDVIKQTRLPARVMTSATSAKKFEAVLSSLGVKYEVLAGVINKEKEEAIKRSKVFFMPSKMETYGLALLEAIPHCQCVVDDNYRWHDNFDERFLNTVVPSNAAERIKILYEQAWQPRTDALQYVKEIDANASILWSQYLTSRNRNHKGTSAAVYKKDKFFYDDHINSLGRFASVEDIASVLGSVGYFNVLHDKGNTFFTRDSSCNEIPRRESNGLDSFFE